MLKLFRWDHRGALPDAPKYVVVGAPHTSNWDFLVMIAFTGKLGMKASWVGKHTLFRGVFGPIFRSLGGIPIDRTRSQGLVEQVAEEFARRDRLALIITPEATRGKSTHWKSGFYRIAQRAGVPILLGSVDYPRRRVEFGPCFEPSGDIDADFETIRAFYEGKRGKYPEKAGEIRPEHTDRE